MAKKECCSLFTKRAIIVGVVIVLLIFIGALLIWNSVRNNPAEIGDNVTVDYTGSLESGEVFDSSIASIGLAGHLDKEEYKPLGFTVGAGKLLAGFEEAVVGMNIGETKVVKLAAEQAYGKHDETKVVVLPKIQKLDRYALVNKSEFVQAIGKEPVVGENISIPGSSWPLKVVSADNITVKLENMLVIGQDVNLPGISWKNKVDRIDDQTIYILQDPEIDDEVFIPSYAGSLYGRVVYVNATDFKLDMNHPLAGKDLIFNITLVSIN